MKSEACKDLLPDGNEVIPLVRQGITQRGIAEGLDRRGNPLCLCGTLQRIYNEFKFLLMTRGMMRSVFAALLWLSTAVPYRGMVQEMLGRIFGS